MSSKTKKVLSWMYGWASDAKNFLYDSGFADAVQLPVRVLSVGNLSMGGTGKTPVVEWLLSETSKRNLKVAVVARNYKAQSFGPCKVDCARADGAQFYGDEPFQIAIKYPQVSVWTGPQKYRTALQAVAFEKLDLLIVDDGLQHRTLKRDFELVLLDTSAPLSENRLLPVGRFREKFSSLNRADAVALTKVNFSDSHRVRELAQKIPAQLPQVRVRFEPDLLTAVDSESRILAVSGIAQPKQFEQSLSSLGLSPADHLIFEDHHRYTQSDALLILQKMKSLECQSIVTTEKDAVKLKAFSDLLPFLNPVQIKVQFESELEGLNEFLDLCLLA